MNKENPFRACVFEHCARAMTRGGSSCVWANLRTIINASARVTLHKLQRVEKKLVAMALVSGRSTLNPNAPLYIPAAFRRVEDFSPEWWDLITTSMWFRDYWLSQHQEAEIMYGNNQNNFQGDDVVDLLPDDIDLGVDEELLNMESQFEEFIKFSGSQESKLLPKDGLVDAKIGSNLGMESQGKPAQKK